MWKDSLEVAPGLYVTSFLLAMHLVADSTGFLTPFLLPSVPTFTCLELGLHAMTILVSTLQ